MEIRVGAADGMVVQAGAIAAAMAVAITAMATMAVVTPAADGMGVSTEVVLSMAVEGSTAEAVDFMEGAVSTGAGAANCVTIQKRDGWQQFNASRSCLAFISCISATPCCTAAHVLARMSARKLAE